MIMTDPDEAPKAVTVTDRVIVGIDPGKMTGVCVLTFRENIRSPKNVFWPGFKCVSVNTDTFNMDEFPRGLAAIYRGIRKGTPIAVAMELYTVSRLTQQTQDVQSIEVIGMEHAVRKLMSLEATYVRQQVSSAKLLFPDARVKQMLTPTRYEWPRIGHERDAIRHAMFFLHRYANLSVDMTG